MLVGLEVAFGTVDEVEEGGFYVVEQCGCLLHNLRELGLTGLWIGKDLNAGVFVMFNSGIAP